MSFCINPIFASSLVPETLRVEPFRSVKEQLNSNILKTAEELWVREVPGSFEARRDMIRAELKKLYPYSESNRQYANVQATFPDYVIFKVEKEDETEKQYVADYAIVDGKLSLGEPKEAQLHIAISVAKETLEHLGGLDQIALEVGKRNSKMDEADLQKATKLLMAVLGSKAEDSK